MTASVFPHLARIESPFTAPGHATSGGHNLDEKIWAAENSGRDETRRDRETGYRRWGSGASADRCQQLHERRFNYCEPCFDPFYLFWRNVFIID